jgi:hypothetical protein
MPGYGPEGGNFLFDDVPIYGCLLRTMESNVLSKRLEHPPPQVKFEKISKIFPTPDRDLHVLVGGPIPTALLFGALIAADRDLVTLLGQLAQSILCFRPFGVLFRNLRCFAV